MIIVLEFQVLNMRTVSIVIFLTYLNFDSPFYQLKVQGVLKGIKGGHQGLFFDTHTPNYPKFFRSWPIT